MAFETPWQREKNSNENFDLLIKTKLCNSNAMHSFICHSQGECNWQRLAKGEREGEGGGRELQL